MFDPVEQAVRQGAVADMQPGRQHLFDGNAGGPFDADNGRKVMA